MGQRNPAKAWAKMKLGHLVCESKRYKLPYIKLLDSYGKIGIWLVDGNFVRSNIEEEFTNFGQHYAFSFIPKSKFWISNETEPDERKFFVEHMLVEYKLMADGASYDEAYETACKAEAKERKRIDDPNIDKLMYYRQELPNSKKAHDKLLARTDNGLYIYLVDGRYVRDNFDVNFVQGGHSLVYPYVSKGEIWIEKDLDSDEMKYIILHELFEYNLMSQRLSYEKAHNEASKIEFYCRQNPGEVEFALEDEGLKI